MFRYGVNFFIFLLSLMLLSCSNGTSQSGTTANPLFIMGVLPNGSTLLSSSGTFNLTNGSVTTATISLTGGTSGSVFDLNFSVSPTGPLVTTNPSPCIITSGSSATCQLIFSTESPDIPSILYKVQANYIMYISGQLLDLPIASSGNLPYLLSFNVGGNPAPNPGQLSILPPIESMVLVGESITATVALSGSESVITPVQVNINSNNTSVLNVSPVECNLTTQNNSCTVSLTGTGLGTTTINATASGYSSVKSESITVNSAPVISVSTTGYTYAESVIQGGNLLITTTLEESTITPTGVDVSNITPLANLYGIQVTITPFPCNNLQNIGDYCLISVVPSWNSAIPGVYTVDLSSSATLSETVIPLSVYQPTVYLQQTGESPYIGSYNVPQVGDGNPAIGINWPASRFVIGSGAESNCITDTLTNLQWPINFGLLGKANWSNALSIVNSMNTNNAATGYNLCGHTDWHLPSLTELLTLINDGYTDNAGSLQYSWLLSQGFQGFNSNYNYWSSSYYSRTNSPNAATQQSWLIHFTDGSLGHVVQTISNGYFIVPVRYVAPFTLTNPESTAYPVQTGESNFVNGYSIPQGADGNPPYGVAWPTNRFIVGSGSESGCIIDNLTGLEWAQNSQILGGNIETWNDALTSVESMNITGNAIGYNLCGHTDWRLPNKREFMSLFNWGYFNGNTNNQSTWLSQQGFTNISPSIYYWTSSSYAQDTSNAWYVYFSVGNINYIDKSTPYLLAWPVRGGE